MRRMSGRGWLAVLVLGSWAAVLAVHVRREFFLSEARRLAIGIRTIPPGAAYYDVFRGDRRVGWARTDIDTLPGSTGFRVRERVEFLAPGLGSGRPIERVADEYLRWDLSLDSLVRSSVVGDDTMRVTVVVAGDSAARVADAAGEVESISLEGPVTTFAGWRLRLAAAGDARPGDRFATSLIDPGAAASPAAEVRVMERRMVAFPDSADTDSVTSAWVAVREDTVLAWRTIWSVGQLELDAWVDEDGRMVDGQIEGGLRVERTAFELAFFNRPWAAAVADRDRTREPRPGDEP